MTKKTKTTKAKKKPAAPKIEDPKLDAEPEAKPDTEPEPEPEPEPSKVSGPDGGFGVPSPEPVAKKAEPQIKIKNLRNKRIDITLEHDIYCNEIGRCVCSKRDVIRERPIERKSKAMARRVETILIPKSIILAPLGTSEPLHKAAEKCADVRSKLINRPQKLKILPA